MTCHSRVMPRKNTQQPEVATGNESSLAAVVPCYGSKRDVAAMLQMSVRSVDNFVARGCPHLRVSSRRLRFDMAEVRAWLSEQYHVQRRSKLTTGAA
jgi:predicted DNA-binding transcriptional regulator AlpA